MIARTRGCRSALQEWSAQLQDVMASVKHGNTHISHTNSSISASIIVAHQRFGMGVDMICTVAGSGRGEYSFESKSRSALYLGVDSSSITAIQCGHSYAEH